MKLTLLPETYVVCRLAPDAPIPTPVLVEGPLDFSLTGILAGLTGALATAGHEVAAEK